MAGFTTAYVAAVLLGTVVNAAIAALALRNRVHAEAKILAVLTTGMAIWTGGEVASIVAASHEWTVLWVQFQWLGVAIVPTTIFVLFVYFSGRTNWVTKRRLGALYVVPVGIYLLVLTTSQQEVLFSAIVPSTATPVGYEFEKGPAFAVYAGYSYLLLAIGSALLVRFIVNSKDIYRGQASLLLVGVVTPWVSNVPFMLDIVAVDPISVGFTVSSVSFAVAMFRYRLTDVVPIGREAVVKHITDGVFVLDRADRIVDTNPQATLYLEQPAPIGESVTECLPGPVSAWLTTATNRDGEATGERATDSTTLAVTRDGETRYLAVEATPLYESGRDVGTLVLVRDVTDQRRYERELERQNDRLDRFASVVSHDLRNPLNVADGYLSILEERYDDPEIEEIEFSLDRMEAIIEDVLTLARNGDEVSDRTRVDLGTLATAAWNGVDTKDGLLRVETGEHRVAADESRLTQALENLFRNAIEHGGADVTITVGTIETDADGTDGADAPHASAADAADPSDRAAGFYVADDGTGIPEDDRDSVLESGYTTNQDGTGLGLSIVRTIVEAHGWSLSVAESAAGGARFEICYDERTQRPSTRPDGESDASRETAESPAQQSAGE